VMLQLSSAVSLSCSVLFYSTWKIFLFETITWTMLRRALFSSPNWDIIAFCLYLVKNYLNVD
jgi:hypothetical protein